MQNVKPAEYGDPGRDARDKFWAEKEYWTALSYSEWLDGQGLMLNDTADSRSHEELVKEWQASRG